MCLSFLKLSYKLITQYEQSQKLLQNYFGTESGHIQNLPNCEADKTSERAPVELISGNSRYNIKDVFVVDQQKERPKYDGFLRLLGKEVNVYFVNKNKKPKHTPKINNYNSVSILPKKNMAKPRKRKSDKTVVQKSNGENLNRQYICEFCGLTFHDFTMFYDHKTECGVIKNVSHINDMDSTELMSSKEPVNVDENNLEDKGGGTKCEFCNVVFNKDMNMNRHRSKCKLVQNMQCNNCKRTFTTEARLINHLRSSCRFGRTYHCQQCSFETTKHGRLRYHIASRHRTPRFICTLCGKRYYTRQSLIEHEEFHKNSRSFLCNVCGKNFNYRSALEYHMRLHSDVMKYKCSICDRGFRMGNSYRRHMMTHTGVRPYKCRFCTKALRSMGELKVHEMLHTGFRPFHCEHCGKGFTKKHNLTVHLKGHKGPYACDLCSKSFIEKECLEMHTKEVHEEFVSDMPDMEMHLFSDVYVT